MLPEFDHRRPVTAARQPVAQGRAGALCPRPEFRDRHDPVVFELIVAEANVEARNRGMINEDDLIQAFERITAQKAAATRRQPDFLVDLSQHGVVRMLCLLEKAGNESEPVRWPADAANQDYMLIMLDDGGYDRCRVVPVDETAIRLRAYEARPPAAPGGFESMAGERAESISRRVQCLVPLLQKTTFRVSRVTTRNSTVMMLPVRRKSATR